MILSIYLYLIAFFMVFIVLFVVYNVYITYERLSSEYRELRDPEN